MASTYGAPDLSYASDSYTLNLERFHRGDVVCRPAWWGDVAKFIFLNFGLHALTIVTRPGLNSFYTSLNIFVALSMPYLGVQRSSKVLRAVAFLEEDDLNIARKAGALCMLVPGSLYESRNVREKGKFDCITPSKFNIHGQYPEGIKRLWLPHTPTDVEGEPPVVIPGADDYALITVPPSFKVRADKLYVPREGIYKRICRFVAREQRELGIAPPSLSSNYSFLKPIIAMIQILYGSYELYKISDTQINRYGYAAYQLTIIPYVLMSLFNLLASMFAPDYPYQYIVLYRGTYVPTSEFISESEYPRYWWSRDTQRRIEHKISGSVGYAYGDFETCARSHNLGERSCTPGYLIPGMVSLFTHAITLGFLIAPYIVIGCLTGWDKGVSTSTQRLCVILWIFYATCGGYVFYILSMPYKWVSKRVRNRPRGYWREHPGKAFWGHILWATMFLIYAVIFLSPPAAGFWVVAKMMINDGICSRL